MARTHTSGRRPRQPRRPTDRVGIIGAGASGLTAAHYLQRAGYEHVTVLERETCVGGKCCSVRVGGHVYEMGALLGTRAYTTTRELMGCVGAGQAPGPRLHCYDLDGHPTDLIVRAQVPRLVWSVLTHYVVPMEVRYRGLRRPGLAGITPELAQPFERFADRHGLPEFQRSVAPPFTGFGYGYFDEVPAAYVMEYLDVPTVEAAALPRRRFSWRGGAQEMWVRLARELDVRTGVTVTGITRDEGVQVRTDHGDLEFDSLILTSPLDEALGFLDASPTERRLFCAIRTYDYWVLLCELDDPPPSSGFLPPNFTRERAGHVMVWHRPWPDQPLCVLYVLGRPGMGPDEITEHCVADLGRLGARLDRVHAVRRWKYFPHVTPEDMAAGYYDELESLQGTRATYYAGELLAFSTVELCARYSKALVRRSFAA